MCSQALLLFILNSPTLLFKYYLTITNIAVGRQFTVQNLDHLYVLVSFAHKTTHCDMTYTMC